jgi:hypothetical protein
VQIQHVPGKVQTITQPGPVQTVTVAAPQVQQIQYQTVPQQVTSYQIQAIPFGSAIPAGGTLVSGPNAALPATTTTTGAK